MRAKLRLLLVISPLLILPVTGTGVEGEFQLQISARVSSNEIPQNRTVKVTVETRWRGPAREVEILDVSPPSLTNLEQVGSSSSVKQEASASGPFSTRTTVYDLRPVSVGMAYVEPFFVKYRVAGDSTEYTLSTKRLSIKVTDPVPDKRGLKPVQVAGIVLLALALILVPAGIVLQQRRKKSREPAPEAPAPRPGEKALDELKAIGDRLGPDNCKESASAIARVLVTYFREELSPDSGAPTAAELVDKLNRAFPGNQLAGRLGGTFERLDGYRFSPGSVDPNELRDLLVTARELVNEFQKLAEAGAPGPEQGHRNSEPTSTRNG